MKFYVQVMRTNDGSHWHQVNVWSNQAAAISDAKHTYANRDNIQSQNVMAVRVVKGKRNAVVVFEQTLS